MDRRANASDARRLTTMTNESRRRRHGDRTGRETRQDRFHGVVQQIRHRVHRRGRRRRGVHDDSRTRSHRYAPEQRRARERYPKASTLRRSRPVVGGEGGRGNQGGHLTHGGVQGEAHRRHRRRRRAGQGGRKRRRSQADDPEGGRQGDLLQVRR